MKQTNALLSLLCAGMLWSASGQEQKTESCLFEEARKEYYQQNPKAHLQAQEFEKIIQRNIELRKSGVLKSGQKYIVPVVFHIYGTDWTTNSGEDRAVTDERVRASLKAVNEDFKGFNDAVDPAFANIEGSMDIEFRLAQIDPKGNTTTGIIHHESREGFGLNGTNDPEIAKYAWDNYKYFNVHIQLILKSGSTTNSGIAWFPSTGMSDEGTARVVYNGKYLIYSPPASSLTHEFGHFFGLEHTFANGGCIAGDDKGDFVADTPPTAQGEGCGPGERNCFGNLINSQNHMDYNPCESMFTKGQVTRMESFMDHPARITLWQDENLVATGIKNDLGPRILFTFQDRLGNDLDKANSLLEGFENDGSIINKRLLKAVDGARFATTGVLQQGTHYNVTGLPSGLNAVVTVTDQITAEISFTGRAAQHEKVNSKDFQVTLLNPAIVGGTNAIYSDTGTYRMEFLDTYTNYYETFSPYYTMGYSTNNKGSINTEFTSQVIGGGFALGLRNYDGNTITLDNSETNFEVLCNANSINVSYLNEGNTVNASSGNWVPKTAVATSPPIISSDNYTSWHGKTGYVGIRIPTINDNYVYGWLQVKVTADGAVAHMMRLGMNPEYGKSIKTETNTAFASYSSDRFLESDANDGTIGNEITLTLHKGASFSASGILTQGTHYTISNVPAGLQFEAQVTGSQTAVLRMKGTLANTEWDYQKNINFALTDAAVQGNASDILFSSYALNAEYLGETFTTQLEDRIMDRNDGSPSSAGFSVLSSHKSLARQQIVYQLQIYDNGEAPGVKFISWRKDAIANAAYELTPLESGDIVGPQSSWKNGREYNSGTGQHMIDSDNYQDWRGKTKYIGIRFRRSGRVHYGWIKFTVSTNGNVLQFLEYGISGIPDKGIYAGTTSLVDEGDEYCAANGNAGVEAITNVSFAGINQTSDRDPNGYEDYTNVSASVQKGGSYPLQVTINGYQGGDRDNIYAWFDWNQDGSFHVTDEYVELTKVNGLTGEATIAVPQNAVSGTTRMRLRVAYYERNNVPCGANDYGEVEDYTVVVSGASTNIPPSVSITSPNDQQQFSQGDPITITAGASDSDGSVQKVEFYRDGTKIGEDLSAPYSYTWNNATSGVYQLSVRAIDDKGASSTSQNVQISVISPLPDYCAANGASGDEAIKRVRFAGIDQSSARDGSGYTDYTQVTGNVSTGGTYNLIVDIEVYRDGADNEVYAWFDWNRDGDFEDSGEYYQLTKTSGTVGQISVNVPQNAEQGSVGMRVRVAYYNTANVPCGESSYGEVEDYAIEISNGNRTTEDQVSKLDNGLGLSKLSVYPNPLIGEELFLDFKNSQKGKVNLRLYNTLGRLVRAYEIEKGEESLKSIQVGPKLASGMYWLQVRLSDKSEIIKVIVD